MSRVLIERIRAIQGFHQLAPGSVTAMPVIMPSSLGFIRITGASRFWEDPLDGQTALDVRQQQFLTGLYQSALPWAFLICGTPDHVEVTVAMSGGRQAVEHWAAPLAACFPGCTTMPGMSDAEMQRRLTNFNFVASITGNPSDSSVQNSHTPSRAPELRIERMIRAMRSGHWAYLAAGTPVSENDIQSELSRLISEEREIVAAYLRPGTSEERNNPLAERYIALIRASRRAHEKGIQTGMWNCRAFLFADAADRLSQGARALSGAFSGISSMPRPFRVTPVPPEDIWAASSSFETILTSGEAALLSRPPAESFPGYTLTRRVRFAPASSYRTNAPCVAVGRDIGSDFSHSNWLEITVDDISKHGLIAGVPGSGKTQTAQFLLSQLWSDHRIPWLVVEPSSKTEYRRLLDSPLSSDLQIYTPGDELVSPLRINPLEVMHGVHVQTHIDGVFALFNASFALVTPMPDVLSLALHELYRRAGWDLVRGAGAYRSTTPSQPTITDLIQIVRSVVADLGYDREVSANIRAGLETRLRNLVTGGKGYALDCQQSTSIEALLRRPTIIELAAIGDDDQKAFFMAALMLRLTEWRRVQGLCGGQLQHVLVLEEAHRLLRRAPETLNAEIANPRGKAVESFCNMLAEVRAYGQGVLILDQIPGKLAPDAVKNTSLKIIHRIVAEDDRGWVGGAMDLDSEQQRHLAKLRTGEAIVFSDSLADACLVGIPNHASHLNYASCNPDNARVRDHMGLGPVRPNSSKAAGSGCFVDQRALKCPDCQEYECIYRTRAVRDMLDNDQRDTFAKALSDGYQGLWKFAKERAEIFCEPGEDVRAAAVCFLLLMATAVGFDASQLNRLRRNLALLFNRKIGDRQ